MVSDPAWFLSSLSQVAAAIIGLLGAILILRLQQQQSDIQGSRDRVLTEFETFVHAAQNFGNYLKAYSAYLNADTPQLKMALSAGATKRSVNNEMTMAGGTRGGSAWEVPVSVEILEARLAERKVCDELREALAPFVSMQSPDELDQPVTALRDLRGRLDPQSREAADRNVTSLIDPLLRHRALHRSRVQPWNALSLLAILAFLAAVSIVWPLSQLIVHQAGFARQDLMLYGFGLGLALLLLYLAGYVRELVRLGSLRRSNN